MIHKTLLVPWHKQCTKKDIEHIQLGQRRLHCNKENISPDIKNLNQYIKTRNSRPVTEHHNIRREEIWILYFHGQLWYSSTEQNPSLPVHHIQRKNSDKLWKCRFPILLYWCKVDDFSITRIFSFCGRQAIAMSANMVSSDVRKLLA